MFLEPGQQDQTIAVISWSTHECRLHRQRRQLRRDLLGHLNVSNYGISGAVTVQTVSTTSAGQAAAILLNIKNHPEPEQGRLFLPTTYPTRGWVITT